MKFGAMNFPIKPVKDELTRISRLGFDYFELSLDPPCAHWEHIDSISKELNQMLKTHSMDIVCHLPTFVYTADLSPAIRNASVNEMLFSLETAARLNAEKVVLHPAIISGLGPFVLDDAKKLAEDSHAVIIEKASQLGLQLCFENMFPRYHHFFDPDAFKILFNTFPDLKMCLDTGHANIGDADQNRLTRFVDQYADKIGHVHISDNLGKRDDHFAVGRGSIHFQHFINQLKQTGYDDTFTLEIFSENEQDLTDSRLAIESMLTS